MLVLYLSRGGEVGWPVRTCAGVYSPRKECSISSAKLRGFAALAAFAAAASAFAALAASAASTSAFAAAALAVSFGWGMMNWGGARVSPPPCAATETRAS